MMTEQMKNQKMLSAQNNTGHTFKSNQKTSKHKNGAVSKKKTTQKGQNIKNTKEGSANSKKAVKNSPSSRKNTKKSAPKKQVNTSPVRIIPLGGLDEIGKNITLYEYENDMVLVDCGMAFPDEDMPGVDIVIPDFSYLIKNADKIRGLVVTHGHEDHIGAIPYLLKQLNIPVYATRLTNGLIMTKLKEHQLSSSAKLIEVTPGQTVNFGKISVEFIHVNHSIPDACGFAIKTPAGVIIQTGDFKIDTTPLDAKIIDIPRFSKLGDEGVLALLSDSTNAERPGYTMSEKIVGDSFSNLFKKANDHRIIVATFSSNIHRIQQIVDEAVRCGRKVAVSGRSMLNVVSIAAEMGYLKIPDGVLIDIDMIKHYSHSQLVIITTGSQGEPMSALHRMAFSDHRKVEIVPGDMIIISATPIPGNEKLVSKVINELMKLGANVVYEKMYDVHVSGHACQEELKLMMSVTKPEFFIPVHGEQKHRVKHAGLAKIMGIDEKNILIPSIGNVIELSKGKMKIVDTVQAGRVLVDGFGVGDVGSIVLRDRKHLAEDGLIVVVTAMESATGEVVSGPELISRGFIYVKESEELLFEAKEVVCDTIEKCYVTGVREWGAIKTRVRDDLSRFLREKTGRSPMILPVIMDV